MSGLARVLRRARATRSPARTWRRLAVTAALRRRGDRRRGRPRTRPTSATPTSSPRRPRSRADNVELAAARAAGVQVATRAEMLGALSALRETLAIAGTHGKTTTSSMLTLILATAGRSPVVAHRRRRRRASARTRGLGTGDELVLEADESYGTFAAAAPALCALTNVEADHLDHYGTIDALHDAFGALARRVGVARRERRRPDRRARSARASARLRVGARPRLRRRRRATCASSARRRASRSRHDGRTSRGARRRAGDGTTSHNAAVAARGGARARRRRRGDVVEALARFAGVPRRFEFRGEVRGATVVDDYAHLPGEVARRRGDRARGAAGGASSRSSSRTATRGPRRSPRDFAGAFDGADVVVVTDVYGAGEPPLARGHRSPRRRRGRVARRCAPTVRYVKDRADVAAAVAALARARATSCSRWARATSRRCADELRAVGA